MAYCTNLRALEKLVGMSVWNKLDWKANPFTGQKHVNKNILTKYMCM